VDGPPQCDLLQLHDSVWLTIVVNGRETIRLFFRVAHVVQHLTRLVLFPSTRFATIRPPPNIATWPPNLERVRANSRKTAHPYTTIIQFYQLDGYASVARSHTNNKGNNRDAIENASEILSTFAWMKICRLRGGSTKKRCERSSAAAF